MYFNDRWSITSISEYRYGFTRICLTNAILHIEWTHLHVMYLCHYLMNGLVNKYHVKPNSLFISKPLNLVHKLHILNNCYK